MALTDNENGSMFTMPVSPMYGNGGNGFGMGSDWAWIILLILLSNGGWGGFGGFGGGMGGFAADGAALYPWMNQAEITSDGFRDQMMNNNITSIRDGISDISTQLCNGFNDVQMGLANGFAGVEAGANARQIANMQQAFAAQTAVTQGMNDIGMSLQNCGCENRAGLADLKYTVATENCADRTAAYQNTRDIIDSQNRGTQAILDKLCALELDGVKGQLAQAQRENAGLQNQLNMAAMQNGLNGEVDALYNRLKNCPVPSMPVYGNTPIFTCNNNSGCGCGCGSF